MFSWFQQNHTPISNQRFLSSSAHSLMISSRQYGGFMKFGEVLQLQGPHISVKALSIAVKKIQHRHPILRSRLQINPAKPNSYLLEEDDTVQLTIREIPRKRADHLTFWQQGWREQEKNTTPIGEGFAEFWLLQDPDDENDNNAPREIVIVCEHSVSDAISLSKAANELLIALVGDNDEIFINSLSWPITMEDAIHRSLSIMQKVFIFSKLIFSSIYTFATNRQPTARIPMKNVDFPLNKMEDYCHTEICYNTLNKEETKKLIEKCRREGVTVTSAVSIAILCGVSTLIKVEDNQSTLLQLSVAVDTRRRCIPPVPDYDLSCHVSSIIPFIIPTVDIPTTSRDIWELAKTFGQYIKSRIDDGQALAFGMIVGWLFEKALDSPKLSLMPTCGVSSWGILPFREQYGQWKLVTMLPFVNSIRGLMPYTAIQTVNGMLTIMYAVPDPFISQSVLKSLCDNTMNKLNQMMED